MTTEDMIRLAQDALGEDRTDDYRIQPRRHADELAAKASSLAAVLRKSDLSAVAVEYERKDKQANENQAIFKGTASGLPPKAYNAATQGSDAYARATSGIRRAGAAVYRNRERTGSWPSFGRIVRSRPTLRGVGGTPGATCFESRGLWGRSEV